MGGLFNKGLSRATAIPRKLDILPEESKSVQGSVDVLRGKKKPSGGGLTGTALGQFGRRTKKTFGSSAFRG